MLFSLLVTLREGFEIALVLAIILGYLARSGHRDRFRDVWLGTLAAVGVTLAVAVVLRFTAAELSGAALEAFEGVTMLGAVLVLTWMVFWMRQGATMGQQLRSQVDAALHRGSLLALVALAFSAVAREGIETALFLFAGASAARGNSSALFVVGGVAGFALAAALGYAIYRGSHLLPLHQFFRVTGVIVLVLAAGLLSTGVAELQESGLIANLGQRPWDTDAWLPITSTAGRFIHTLAGYDPAPTWGQIGLYWGYLLIGVGLYLAPPRRPWSRRRAVETAQARR